MNAMILNFVILGMTYTITSSRPLTPPEYPIPLPLLDDDLTENRQSIMDSLIHMLTMFHEQMLLRAALSDDLEIFNGENDKPDGASQRSILAPVPLRTRSLRPVTGDVGACRTEIYAPERMLFGSLYDNSTRKVVLWQSISPRGVRCLDESPVTGSGHHRCVLVAYPHGAWIVVSPKDLGLHHAANCLPIEGSRSKRCWDYVIVPGYCVQERLTP